MYFDDLSFYRYGLPRALVNVRHVGWLGKEMEHAIGDAPGLVEALKRWNHGTSTNRMRGFEVCSFCCPANGSQMSTSWNNKILWLGSAEIWMPDGQEGFFAAPNLIIHYVEAHQYLPPSQFVEAALEPIPEDWDADKIADQMTAAAFL